MNRCSLDHDRWAWHAQMCRGTLLVVLAVCGPASHALAEPTLTPEQAAIARQVEEQLMAPCCFGSTVATHHSPAADAIRDDVRSLVAQGATAQQILDQYLDRYGERILAQPVARGFNLLAYWMPLVGLVCGTGIVVIWLLRRRTPVGAVCSSPNQEHVSDDTHERLRRRFEEELAEFDG